MSNQIVITSGAKVRGLDGVLTGTSGIVNSVPLGAANGVATLDAGGKVPVSQLPSSVVTYLGTWNAATNTPTLVNGTGDAGDLYICNVAGTANFGAGPITFAVGDWVLYGSGTWQKSSGQNGTVTSVAASITGNSLGITGSPITTAGTLAFAFAGTNLQYINGAGDLTTFPSLTGYVPYTGATGDVDLGVFKLNAASMHIKGTAGNGHLGLKHQSASPTGSANESLIFADVNGDLGWLNDNLYLNKFVTSANTANRTYTFPNATGTVALTSDLSSYVPYTGATANVNLGTFDLSAYAVSADILEARLNGTASSPLILRTGTSGFAAGLNAISLISSPSIANTLSIISDVSSVTKTAQIGLGSLSATRTYTLPDASGTIALTSNLSSYVPYTGATADVDLGVYNFKANIVSIASAGGSNQLTSFANTNSLHSASAGLNVFGFNTSNNIYFGKGLTGGGLGNGGVLIWSNTQVRYYTLPNADGTLALVGGSGVGTVTSVAALTLGTTGTDLSSTVADSTTTPVITLNVPTASATNRGALSSADWTTFNNKQNALTNPVTGTGTTNTHAKFTSASVIGNSMVSDDGTTLTSAGATRSNLYIKAVNNSYYGQLAFTNGTNGSYGGISYNNASQYMQFETNTSEWMRLTSDGKLGIGTTSPAYTLDVSGTGRFTGALNVNLTSAASAINLVNTSTNNIFTTYSNASNNTYIGLIGNNGVVQTNNDFEVYTGASYTKRLTITSAGNVGIGVTPYSSTALSIKGTYGLWIERGATNDSGIAIYHDGTNALFSSSYQSSGAFGGMAFYTSNIQRLTITSAGNVGIGTSGPAYTLDVSGNIAATRFWVASGGNATDPMIRVKDDTDTGIFFPAANIMAFSTGATERMRIISSGNISIATTTDFGYKLNLNGQPGCNGYTAWTNWSDSRLKENVTDLETTNVLDKICAIRPVTYNYNELSGFDEATRSRRISGFIAQELMEVFPDMVGTIKKGDDEYYDTNLSNLTLYLVKAIQELSAKNEELSNRLIKLENK